MGATRFIAGKIRFRSRIAMVSIAVSFLVMILAVAVSSGFRREIRDGITSVSGDLAITPSDLNYLSESSPISAHPSYLGQVKALPEVAGISPVVYRAGIVKQGELIHGVLFKGIVQDVSDSLPPFSVSIPSRLAELLGVEEGGSLQTYFVGEKVKVRKFHISSVHPSLLEADDQLVVHADIRDLQRLNGWGDDRISAFEISLQNGYRTEADYERMRTEIGNLTLLYSDKDEESVVCSSAVSAHPQLFDWLRLIDFNVWFILGLMTVVAGFNMISGLLILLFENISTIGILKSMGMGDRDIAKVFLRTSSSIVLKGMAAGNVLAFLLCAVQAVTHLVTLNPDNYFVSYVPVQLDVVKILAADLAAYLVIMLLLLLPSLFISKVDPAQTVRMG